MSFLQLKINLCSYVLCFKLRLILFEDWNGPLNPILQV